MHSPHSESLAGMTRQELSILFPRGGRRMAEPIRVIIMGAAGRDFHNFNTCFRHNPNYKVVAFTATQIPDIEGRLYPACLAGEDLYPEGIPIYSEDELDDLIAKFNVDQVVFAYSDTHHNNLMHKASRVLADGPDFRLIGPKDSALKSKLPVVAICAVRTGVGKSQTTRSVVDILKKAGLRVAAVRHPMPYGDLAKQAVQRFATMADLDKHECTIEEREEYAPHIENDTVVFAGVDYEAIMHAVEAEPGIDVLLWDGGNNDFSFYKADLYITLADPHRPGHESLYYPGEVNVRCADAIIINKIDTADPANVKAVAENCQAINPKAKLIYAESPMTADKPEIIKGKRVLVIEDGPTLTHGEMPYGAGMKAAEKYGAAEIVDPRPFAVGSLKDTFAKWKHLGPILPAMGYSAKQCHELQETIANADVDTVVVGTPIDLAAFIEIKQPNTRIRYDLKEKEGAHLEDLLQPIIKKAMENRKNNK